MVLLSFWDGFEESRQDRVEWMQHYLGRPSLPIPFPPIQASKPSSRVLSRSGLRSRQNKGAAIHIEH